MSRTTKRVFAACIVVFSLVAIVIGGVALTFDPESKVQFTSLTLTPYSKTGCGVHEACLNIDMRFDCQFRISLPETELPDNWQQPLALSERLQLLLGQLSLKKQLPMGLGSASIPFTATESCEILVDDESTYNVVPGSPLAVAKMIDENGTTRTAYVSAESN